jgi:hypothetical protein
MARNHTGRRRGGQLGNKNALRHGLYSEVYSVKEAKNLQDRDIGNELLLWRFTVLFLARIAPFKKKLDDFTPNDFALLELMNSYGISINSYERTLLLAKGKGGELGQTIWDALMGRDPNNDKE